jgi:ubiquinone/menaquinone biosynthesis C-methylase UbiE
MNGSYQFEQLESRHQEAHFLAERAQMRLEGFISLLEAHGFPNRGLALDLGCGHGLRSSLMAKHFQDVKVIGVDRSLELLEMARAKERHPHLSFEHADLYRLPYESHSFDFIYSRLVFMHLSEPLKALKEMRRILKPGGRILIEDADRDCMFFEPTPPSFASYWKKIQEGQRRLGGDPNVGRKLASYFHEINLHDLKIEVQPILGNGEHIEYLMRTLFPSLNAYLKPEDRKEGEEAIQDLLELAHKPFATFYHFWFAVSAGA